MEKYLYICQYCAMDYVPRRRKQQKFCSNSCRTRAFNSKKEVGLSIPKIKKSEDKTSIDKMSLAGVGNAAAGTLAINALTSLLTKEENKPATKKDINDIKNIVLQRYHEVINMPLNQMGYVPFYDIETRRIVYLKK